MNKIMEKWNGLNKRGKIIVCVVALVIVVAIVQGV
tara:strand:+ start:381 stop:485 length:105 start_codon:yes stop_codon:yes gene_type:complete